MSPVPLPRLRSAGRLALALVVCALLVPARAGAAVEGCVADATWGTPRPDLVTRVVTLVNEHRVSLGLSPLEMSPALTRGADWKARHMAAFDYLTHEDPAPPVARGVGDRLAACGYPVDRAGWGENIAFGYRTEEDVVRAWLASPGHRANIERASFRATGVAATVAADGTVFWAQEFGTEVESDLGPALPGGPADGLASPTAPTPAAGTGPRPRVRFVTPARSARPARNRRRVGAVVWATTGAVTGTTCRFGRRPPVPCASPLRLPRLRPGRHLLRVRVSGPGGSARAVLRIVARRPAGR